MTTSLIAAAISSTGETEIEVTRVQEISKVLLTMIDSKADCTNYVSVLPTSKTIIDSAKHLGLEIKKVEHDDKEKIIITIPKQQEIINGLTYYSMPIKRCLAQETILANALLTNISAISGPISIHSVIEKANLIMT